MRDWIEKRKNNKLTDEQAVSSLGLISWERQKFLKSLKAIEFQFQKRLKQTRALAQGKAKQGMALIVRQGEQLFRDEWTHIVDQYNRMRDGLFTAE